MQRQPSQTRVPAPSSASSTISSSSGPYRSDLNPAQAVPLALSPSARRKSSHSFADEEDDSLFDPKPWETRKHPRQYGSLPPKYQENHILAAGDYSEKNLPMFRSEENEPRRRHAVPAGSVAADGGVTTALGQPSPHGRAEGAAAGGYGEKGELLFDVDDQGKWMKGYGAGPGVGGRRGLPPRQRLTGWRGFYVEWEDPIWAAVYLVLSMLTRYWRIGAANYVVWDEAHFGKFGSHYINRDFYFDVHPPLGKMLVGLAGLLSGYNGGFEFKSGVEYPADLPHTAMRVMLASFGVMLVPLAWWTAGEMGWSRFTRHWVTICVLCDIGWLCISRFILLDSMLLFFTFTTTLGLVKFHSQRHDSFNEDWWAWLIFTGWSIGCVCSVKWVGMFVTAMVGVYTIEDLWDKFGDLRMPVRTYIKHWAARITCLIVLPFIVYATCFKIHFLVLNRSGPGDAQMSSLFQSHLKGNDFAQSPLEVAYGSKLTLKNYGYGGGLLHSHVQTYPVGSQQQQVTCYHYKDDNNHWVITPPWSAPPVDPEGEIRYLLNGDSVRLVHAATGRNLHSHMIAAPVSKEHYEVAGYGNATIGDDNDLWTVEIVDDTHRSSKDQKDGKVHSLTTRMRFRHKVLNCYLRAANSVLPQWGFKQVEVTCDKVNNPKDVHTYWNVESHWNERSKLYKSPFWRDFAHLNVAMWTSNNALIPDPDKDDILASSPTDWPFLHLGLRMCGWGDSAIKFYLLGTPIIWWGSTAALALSFVVLGWYILRMQRQYKDWRAGEWEEWIFPGKVAFWGWFMHFAPFLIMGRVTYLHHYLPTLYFAVLMMGHLLDHFFFAAPRPSHGQAESYVSARPLSGPSAPYPIGSPGPSSLDGAAGSGTINRQNPSLSVRSRSLKVRTIWFAIWAGAVIVNFWWFKDLALGIHGNVNDHKGWKWRDSWNIYN